MNPHATTDLRRLNMQVGKASRGTRHTHSCNSAKLLYDCGCLYNDELRCLSLCFPTVQFNKGGHSQTTLTISFMDSCQGEKTLKLNNLIYLNNSAIMKQYINILGSHKLSSMQQCRMYFYSSASRFSFCPNRMALVPLNQPLQAIPKQHEVTVPWVF